MFKLIFTAAALIGVLAAPALQAQEDKPGEARAAPSKPATKDEKAAAKQQRRTTSKEIAHGKGSLDSDNTDRTIRTASPEQKALGKAKRKSEGSAAAKADSGRLEDEGGAQK